ncbi:MAG: alpha/beta hydrolase-fold protein [Sandaracinus sp.]
MSARAHPIVRGGRPAWRHRGPHGASFETFDALDLDDPFGPRDVHVLLPESEEAARGDVSLVIFNDGDTTFWSGGVGRDTWDVAGTVSRLRAEGAIAPLAVVAVHPTQRDEEYTHVDWRRGRAPWGGLDRYAAWLAGTLVPWLHESYPWLTRDRTRTAIVGSSHGGLAAFRTATSHAAIFGVGGCMSPSFFSGLDDLDHGLARTPIERSDLVHKAAPVLADPELRPRLWIDWGMRRDGGLHNSVVEALAAARGAQMVELLAHRFGARVARIGAGERPPRDAEVIQCVDAIGGHGEPAWRHRTELLLRAFF